MPVGAAAQQKTIKEQLIGSWSFISWEQTYPDGRKDPAFGANPKGVNTFEANGRFTLIVLRPDIPATASNDRARMTPEEAMAIARGTAAYYGTYTVNEEEKSLSLTLEGTTVINQLAQPQKRFITTISADELKYHTQTNTTTGAVVQAAFKRIK
jgi:hypothetical protein